MNSHQRRKLRRRMYRPRVGDVFRRGDVRLTIVSVDALWVRWQLKGEGLRDDQMDGVVTHRYPELVQRTLTIGATFIPAAKP